MSEMFVRSESYIEKASKLSEGEVEFVVSTGDIDAHGERINIDGIDLKDFKKNPVVLWGHDGFNLPIAKATKIWKQDGKLMARAMFYLKDDFANKVYNYILDGYLNAVSIGGMVKQWGEDGMTISQLLMKEFSVVSVPANQNALVSNKSLDSEQVTELHALANAYARKVLSKGDNEIFKNIETLETLVATLKEVAHSEPDVVEADENINRRVVLRTAQAVDKQVETVIRQIKLKGDK
jgi:HK97 family phage prohead protease